MTTMPGELPNDESPDPFVQFGPGGMALLAVCKTAAVAGALVFTGLVVMSVVSITGRKLWSTPVPGDVELLQMCSAFAAASFFASTAPALSNSALARLSAE